LEPAIATLASRSRFEDRYEILEEIGSGPFSCVYHARQLSTDQSVAIKLLRLREGAASASGREAERFRRETQICAALSHTNIVRLIDSGETRDGSLYAVFEHVPGETFEQALAREGRLEVRESLRLMTQALDALACAHAQGVVHRDLKPSNLMLSGTGARRNALVLDFGLGGLAEGRRRQEWRTLTQSGAFVGTPLYASPEQLTGEPATPRSDLYAWGLVFLECLTGRHPFAEGDALFRGNVEIPDWLHGHRLGQLLETVTARDAAKRDLSAEALIEALDEIARGELPVAPEAPGRRIPPPLSRSGERRHLTVMFCDLVDSAGLARRLGAEAYRRVMQACQATAAEAVEGFGGHVVQYLGDGLLVYFGHPRAHEDDATRAVRAGREVLRQVQVLNPRLEAEEGVRLALRIGIHSGPVVVSELGSGAKRETLALGETPTIAARLEAFAERDTLVISEATLHLVAGLFVTEDLGTPELKGIAEPVRVHRVLHPSGVESRLDRALALTPFVGREQELALLLDRFEQAQESRGQAVLIGGEAGIGKSRLVLQLRERLRESPHSWLECRCTPYTRQSAFYPVIELLERALDLHHEDSSEEKLERLERGLAHAGLEPAKTVPLFASLLSLRLPERYATLEISPQLQRQKTLEALLAWLLALGEKQPMVLLVEDLHWVDPSTLEWLGLLIEQCPTAGVLLLLTFRPEFEPPWSSREHMLPVALRRLRRHEAMHLVSATIPEGALTEALMSEITDRSDGVPLFVEELAKGVVESGRDATGTLSDLAIPETLQDSLMARLDRLGEAKQVAQLGAALGREFPYALLEAVAPLTEAALREGLGRLVEAELIYQRGLPPKAIYTFKHALVQDTAYQSLLESQRQELHGRIADALVASFPERAAREPELVARHCEEAGRVAQATAYYQRAGARATRRWAHAEAIGHLRRAIELLSTLPESIERNQQELQLQVALGPSLIATKGYGDREVERVYGRSRELCQQVGEKPELVRVVIGLSMFFHNRGELRTATDLAAQAVALAEQAGEAYPLLAAHTRLGITLNMMGELSRAHEHFEQAIDLYDPAEHRSLTSVWGHDWGIFARGFAAINLLARGYPERAQRLMQETVELAREGDPFSLSFALAWDAQLHSRFRELDRVKEPAEEALAIALERGFPFVLGWATVYRGVALGGSQGLEEIQRGLALVVAAKAVVYLSGWSLHLAEAYRELGRTEDALAALESASRGLPGSYDSELERIRGEILLQQGAAEEAECCFGRALGIARDQDARFYELQAATSLARMLCDQGRRDEARALLQPVYDWFTEGFNTADLKDAKALLDELV
jgi:TOMM system kinase/cyclase fusion protein